MAKTTKLELARHDGPIMLPLKATLAAAIDALQRQLAWEDEPVSIDEALPGVFPWDGARAMVKAMAEVFGEFSLMAHPYGALHAVEVAPGKTEQVQWGRFKVASMAGFVATSTTRDSEGHMSFTVTASTLNKHQPDVMKLIARTKEIAAKESIYRGKAFSATFRDRDGDPTWVPTIKFVVPTTNAPIFSADTERAVDANILTPIRHFIECRRAGIPFKRGTLLGGPYGTGKTLLAGKVANMATLHGVTFVYVPDCHELADALQFAKAFQPAVVFVEDVERIAGSERDDKVNELLNTLDGIGSKNDDVMLVMTSNHAESINAAMRRPGRIDMVLPIGPPDAEACERLIFHYSKGTLEKGTNVMKAADMLAGMNPATVREACERAKLEALRRSDGAAVTVIGADIEAAAKILRAEAEMFRTDKGGTDDATAVGEGLKRLGNALTSPGAREQLRNGIGVI